MDLSQKKLDAEWQAKLDALVEEHKKALEEALGDASKTLQREMDQLIRSHSDEIQTLKNALQKEATEAAEESAKAEQERIRLVAELAQEKADREHDINEIRMKMESGDLESAERHRKELETLRKELTSSAEAKEKKLTEQYELELLGLRSGSEKQLTELAAKLKAEAEQREKELSLQQDLATAALQESLQKQKAEALVAQENAHSNAMESMKLHHATEVGALNQTIGA